MSARYTSRGKGWAEIAGHAQRLLKEASVVDPETGEAILTAEAIQGLKDLVDDWDHFADPMAWALYRLMTSKNGRLTYQLGEEEIEEH